VITKNPKRRDVLRILAVGGAAAAVGGWTLLRRGGAGPVTRTRTLMGTLVNLTVLGDDREAAEAAVEATLERMARLESLLSRHRGDSEVSRLNATGRVEGASEALLDVLRLAERVSEMGDGAFDVTVQPVLEAYRAGGELPDPEAIERRIELVGHRSVRIEGGAVALDRSGARITLDGIGKGYIVDRGVDVLAERGFPDVFVEAGGDLMASGDKGADGPWRIGIRAPRSGMTLQARFDARNVAGATSGDYMQPFTSDYRQHHILDPRTGYSAPELASSTVLAPDAATADALATLTMVLGSGKGRELLEGIPGCEGYFVSKEMEVMRTSGFAVG
jgi:thiamine biosynthesis lipoprotein